MRKKKHLNRIAVDLCTPTAERRPTTAEDIRNDVFIEDFSNSEELYEFVLDLTDMTDEDVIYELDGDDTVENKIKYLLGFYDDPSDGSPNIQYCCVDGKELDNVLRYDAFDGLNFDDADSETLADILLDEYEYSEDDDDEWDDEDEDDDLNEDKEKKKNLNKGETKMKNAEKKYYVDFVLKGTAEVYAHDFEEAEDIVQELFDEFYYGNDSDSFPHELADGIESIEIDDVELDTDDDDDNDYDEDDFDEDLDTTDEGIKAFKKLLDDTQYAEVTGATINISDNKLKLKAFGTVLFELEAIKRRPSSPTIYKFTYVEQDPDLDFEDSVYFSSLENVKYFKDYDSFAAFFKDLVDLSEYGDE